MNKDLKIGDVAIEKVSEDLVKTFSDIEYRRDFVRREMAEIGRAEEYAFKLLKDCYNLDSRYGYSLNHKTGKLTVCHINPATEGRE